MRANEFRIGNITDKGTVVTFYESGIHVGYGKCFKFNEVNGIELTPEWLVKLGFDKSDYRGEYDEFCLYEKESFNIAFNENNSGCISISAGDYSEDGSLLKHIKYVHQIQNLYFALTNKELKIQS